MTTQPSSPSTVRLINLPANQPSNLSTVRPIYRLTNQPSVQSTIRPINPHTNQPSDQSIVRPINHPTYQLSDQSIVRPINLLTNQDYILRQKTIFKFSLLFKICNWSPLKCFVYIIIQIWIDLEGDMRTRAA